MARLAGGESGDGERDWREGPLPRADSAYTPVHPGAQLSCYHPRQLGELPVSTSNATFRNDRRYWPPAASVGAECAGFSARCLRLVHGTALKTCFCFPAACENSCFPAGIRYLFPDCLRSSARVPRYDSAVHTAQLWKRLGSLTTVCRRPEATTTNVDGGAVRHNKYKYRRRLVCLR